MSRLVLLCLCALLAWGQVSAEERQGGVQAVSGVEIEFSRSGQRFISLSLPSDEYQERVKQHENRIINSLQQMEETGEYLITTYSVNLDDKYLWNQTGSWTLLSQQNSDRSNVFRRNELPLVWSLVTKVGTVLDRFEYSRGIRCESESLQVEVGDRLVIDPDQRSYRLRVERGGAIMAADGLVASPSQVDESDRRGRQRVDISRLALNEDAVRVHKQGTRLEHCGVRDLAKDIRSQGYFHFEMDTGCLMLRNLNIPEVAGMVTYMDRHDEPGCEKRLDDEALVQSGATISPQAAEPETSAGDAMTSLTPDDVKTEEDAGESEMVDRGDFAQGDQLGSRSETLGQHGGLVTSSDQSSLFWFLGLIAALVMAGFALLTWLGLNLLRARQQPAGANPQNTSELVGVLEEAMDKREGSFDTFTETQGKFQKGLETGLNRVFERVQKDAGETKQGVADVLEAFKHLQNALDQKDKEIDRLRQGYDLEIFKRFVGRFIRLEKVIAEDMADIEAGKGDAKETLDDLKTLLEDALEFSGLKRYYPSEGVDIALVDGIDDDKEQRPAPTAEQALTVAEVLEPGWQLETPDGPVFVKKARVAIYVQTTNHEQGES